MMPSIAFYDVQNFSAGMSKEPLKYLANKENYSRQPRAHLVVSNEQISFQTNKQYFKSCPQIQTSSGTYACFRSESN